MKDIRSASLRTMSKELLDSLLNEISTGNLEAVNEKIGELTEEQLDALFGEAQAFKSLGTASSSKFVVGSVSNLRERYLKKLITTAMVGFLFQMKDEYTVGEDDLSCPPSKEDFMEEQPSAVSDDFDASLLYEEELTKAYTTKFPTKLSSSYKEMELELSEDELLEVSKTANDRFKKLTSKEKALNATKYNEAIEASVKEQSDAERKVIDRYLSWLFKYDESIHTQRGDHEVSDDPERTPIEDLKGTSPVYDNIPPNDTHCRFTSYYEINYEKMREATNNIYNTKPDLEHAMIVYDVVDTQAEVDSFIHKYGSTAKYDILSFPLNKWTLMGPFKENRDRVNYYNKHNEIIKAMLAQQETDAALGEDLMKKRIRTTKAKAEKVFGKDSPGFEEYKKMNPSELESKFSAKVTDANDDKITLTKNVVVDADTGEELKLDDEGVPLNALEIPITTINARTGETSQTRIFSRSEDK